MFDILIWKQFSLVKCTRNVYWIMNTVQLITADDINSADKINVFGETHSSSTIEVWWKCFNWELVQWTNTVQYHITKNETFIINILPCILFQRLQSQCFFQLSIQILWSDVTMPCLGELQIHEAAERIKYNKIIFQV